MKPTNHPLKQRDYANINVVDKAVKISEFLNTVDVSQITASILRKHPKDSGFRYPIPAMIRSVIFMKLKGLRFETELARHFKKTPKMRGISGLSKMRT